MIVRLLRLFTPTLPTDSRVVPVPNITDQPLHERANGDHPLVAASTRAVSSSLSALAFWTAIALPVLYLPLLVTGLRSTGELLVFLALFGVHVLALLAGRSHRRDGHD